MEVVCCILMQSIDALSGPCSMMHYQAVASPAGVINDVTHHTILPPLLSITSALQKCTTNSR